MKCVEKYKSNRNVVYSCKYHIVWCPKYRRKVLVGEVEKRLKEIIQEVAKEYDVDLSLTNQSRKIGWDSDWYNDRQSIVYSGDVTDGEDGVVELFQVKDFKGLYIVKINDFSNVASQNRPLKFKFFVGVGEYKPERNRMITADELVFETYLEMEVKSIILGFVYNNVFYFGNFKLPDRLVSNIDSEKLIEAIKLYMDSGLYIDEVIDGSLITSDESSILGDKVLDLCNPSKEAMIELIK